MKPTRLSYNSVHDTTANLRISLPDRQKWGLVPGPHLFFIKHSDGKVVRAAGNVTKAVDKAYLTGLGVAKRYDHTSPYFKDTRPIEILRAVAL